MKIKSQKDFVSGLMFTAVGIAFAVGATSYNVGNGARMGPGYFPLLLGILLALLGAGVIFSSLVIETDDGEPIGRIAWRPLVFIIGSNLVFGLLLGGVVAWGLPAMGLIAAIYAVVLISALASPKFDLKEALILATILAIGSYLTFVLALKLQFQVWPTFITG